MSSLSHRRRAALLAALVLCILPLGPSLAIAGEGPIVFKIALTQAARPKELNPFLATTGTAFHLMADMYDLLVEFGPETQPAPGLAESWETSPDGLTWTYHIRTDATWHDGQPVTADDARFTLQYIIDSHDPAYVGPAAPDGNDLIGDHGNPDGSADNPLTLFDNYLDLDGGIDAMRIASITAPDANTLVITTTAPLATLSQMYIPILPEHIWGTRTFAASAADGVDVAQAIGSGPFKMVDYQPRQVTQLAANETYWGGRPHIDTLIYQFFDNDEAQVNALKDGTVDFLDNFPPTLIETLRGDPNITVNQVPSSDFGELGFNSWNPTPERFEAEGCPTCDTRGPTTGSLGDPWLTRPDVRAAVASLLDKKELIRFALSGYGTPGTSVVSPLSNIYHYQPEPGDPMVFPDYTDDAGKATARATVETRFRDIMAGLGFADTDGNGILNVPSTPEATTFDPAGAGADWSLRLFARDDDEEDKLAAELMEGWFESAGISIDRREIAEDPVLYAATYPSETNADMDMYIWGWGQDPDPDFILSIFACDQINNWQDSNYCDPAYDDLYRQSRTTTDRDARGAIVRQLQDKVFHESPYSVLWYIDTLEAYRSDRWEGVFTMPYASGAIWSDYAFGPWGSRVTIGPIGGAGEPMPMPAATPEPSPPAEPTATPGPTEPGATATPVPSATATSATTADPTATDPSQTAAPTVSPSPSPSGGTGSGGGSTTVIVAAAGAVVAVGLLFVWMRRRRLDEDDDD